jgi:anti-anti-sigma factor
MRSVLNSSTVVDSGRTFRIRIGVAVDRRNTAEGGFGIDDSLEAAAGGGRVYADKRLIVTRTRAPYGLRFTGEIDVTNSHAVDESLRASVTLQDQDLHLDVSGLIFCDISGIRSFVDLAEKREAGRLMLHGMPELLQTVLRVTGWADLPTLVICDCRRNGA